MKLNKSILKQLIKEELETMVAEERPPTNAELTMKRLRSLLPEFAAVDAKADAVMGNQKRMKGTLDTLPPEVHAEYKKHYEDYGRANFGDSLRETLQEQVAQEPLQANDIAPAVYAGMKANKNRSRIQAGDFVRWGEKNGLELEYVHATDTTRRDRKPSELAFRVLRTSDITKALEAKATGIADHVHVVQPPGKDKYYILYSGEGIVDRTSQANMKKTIDSNKVPFDYKKEKKAEKPAEKPTEKPQNRYMTIGGVPFYGEREYYPTGVYESKTITKSILKRMIKEELESIKEDLSNMSDEALKNKYHSLGRQMPLRPEDDPYGSYFSLEAERKEIKKELEKRGKPLEESLTQARDAIATKLTLRQIIREEARKLVEMKRLKKLQARDAERGAASSDVNKLYTLYALAPNHDLVKKAGGVEAILEKIRKAGYGVYSGLKNPHLNLHSREIFNQNIEDMYNLAFGEEPDYVGDEDMHTYDSLNKEQKKDLYNKVWDAYNEPGDRGMESIWAEDFDLDS